MVENQTPPEEALGKELVIRVQTRDEEEGTIALQERDWTLSEDELGEPKNGGIRAKRERDQGYGAERVRLKETVGA